jgi:predicted metal-dependent enzyme (double-stranded beta helix superfamily)
MTTPNPSLPGLEPFCDACADLLADLVDCRACVERVEEEFSRLLAERQLFAEILRDLAEGGGRIDPRRPTAFDNEVLLYAHPGRAFSLRLYLYEPGRYTPVHDHNAWGLIGPIAGALEVVSFRREDDGSRPGYARVAEVGRRTLRPAEHAANLPLDQGIHRVGNPTATTLPSLSLYGRPVARGYVQEFDPATGRVYRIMRPHAKKRMLAAAALEDLCPGKTFR